MNRHTLTTLSALLALALILTSADTTNAQTMIGRGLGGYRGVGVPTMYGPGYYGGSTGYPTGFGPVYRPGFGYGGVYNIPSYTPMASLQGLSYGASSFTGSLPTKSSGGYYTNYSGSAGVPSLTANDLYGPGYPSYFPPNPEIKQPDPATAKMPVSVDVHLPTDAQLWFEGQKTSQSGDERSFQSPPIDQGQTYTYVIRARWTENGNDVEQTRKVHVKAGDRVKIDFTKPE
jgi:uncharacterized protein (TIGR03000 family)